MHRKKKSGCLFVILTAIAFVLALKFGPFILNDITKKSVSSVYSVPSSPSPALISQSSDISVSIDTGALHSPCAILVRLSDNAVLMQKQSDEKIYPASLKENTFL